MTRIRKAMAAVPYKLPRSCDPDCCLLVGLEKLACLMRRL